MAVVKICRKLMSLGEMIARTRTQSGTGLQWLSPFSMGRVSPVAASGQSRNVVTTSSQGCVDLTGSGCSTQPFEMLVHQQPADMVLRASSD